MNALTSVPLRANSAHEPGILKANWGLTNSNNNQSTTAKLNTFKAKIELAPSSTNAALLAVPESILVNKEDRTFVVRAPPENRLQLVFLSFCKCCLFCSVVYFALIL